MPNLSGQRNNSDNSSNSTGTFMQNSAGYYVVNSVTDPGGGQMNNVSGQIDHFLQEIDAGDLAQLLPELVGDGQNESYLSLDSSTLSQAQIYENFDHSNFDSRPSTSSYCATSNGEMSVVGTNYNQFGGGVDNHHNVQNSSAVIASKPVCQYQNLLTSSNLRVGYRNSLVVERNSSDESFNQPQSSNSAATDMSNCSGHAGGEMERRDYGDFSPTRSGTSGNRRHSQNGSTLMSYSGNSSQQSYQNHQVNGAGDNLPHRNVPAHNKEACGGSPDSGIQSIEGSPAGCQSSPFPLASPSPLSQASPRVYGHSCSLTAPYCPNQDLVSLRQSSYARPTQESHVGYQSDLNQPLR